MKKIRVFAPATVANVACGFDVLGFAINEPGDEIQLELSDTPGIHISKITGDQGRLPTETAKNTGGVALLEMCRQIGYEGGITMEVHKKMPLGSGLGSSAASAVGAVVALNELLGNPLSRKDLLPFVLEAERTACGAAHADNAAASLLGGFILVRSNEPLDVISLPWPKSLHAVVIHPHIEIRTEDTRRILRKNVSLTRAVQQWGNLGAFVASLHQNDFELMSRSLEDVIIEPVRGLLIPGFDAVKRTALNHGALGAGISGSGPSIFALCENDSMAHKVGAAMQEKLASFELSSDLYLSLINADGPKIL